MTDSGIVICAGLIQKEKVLSPIDVTDGEIMICVSDEQEEKAPFSIDVILLKA